MAEQLKTYQKPSFAKTLPEPEDRQADIAFYHSPEWRALRNYHLRQFPLCNDCQRPGNECHHIKDRKTNPELALDSTNLETLCKPCHSRRTMREKFFRYGECVVLLGYPDQRANWLKDNQREGDLLLDLDQVAIALGFPYQPWPADIKQLLASWRLELLRQVKLQQLKRRCIVCCTDWASADQIAKELAAEVTQC